MSRTKRKFHPAARNATSTPERDGANHHGVGSEWMSGRSGVLFAEPGKYTKRLTHRLERRVKIEEPEEV